MTNTITGTPTVRGIPEDEWDAMVAVDEIAFLGVMSPEERDRAKSVQEFDRAIGVYDGPQLVGTASAYSFDMSAPGRSVPTAGVTWVSVLPTHRRRGVLTALMRQQLHGMHEQQQEPVAALWASEPPIYGRFGYGAASRHLAMKLSRDPRALVGAPADGSLTIRLVRAADSAELTNTVYDAVARRRPGLPARNAAWLARAVEDPQSGRSGRSELRCVLVEDHNGVRAYARYATESKWAAAGAEGIVHVREVMGSDPAAYAAVWRYLLDLDLTARVHADNQPIDDPLLELLGDPRRAAPVVHDGLFVRLVDVDRALVARAYPAGVDVVIELVDDLCPWNSGRWQLAGDETTATCDRTDAAPELAIGATELGAAYLGGMSLRRLAEAGRVKELRSGSLDRASRAFAHEPAPWCPFVF